MKIRVIPDMQLKAVVEYQTERKFNGGYDDRTVQKSSEQTHMCMFCVDGIHQQKAQSSGKQHTPVCVASPQKLNNTVSCSACEKKDQCFN